MLTTITLLAVATEGNAFVAAPSSTRDLLPVGSPSNTSFFGAFSCPAGSVDEGEGCEGQVDSTASMSEEEPVQVTGVDWVCWIRCIGGREEIAADRLAIADEARGARGTEAKVVDVAFAAVAFINSACRAGESAKGRGVRW